MTRERDRAEVRGRGGVVDPEGGRVAAAEAADVDVGAVWVGDDEEREIGRRERGDEARRRAGHVDEVDRVREGVRHDDLAAVGSERRTDREVTTGDTTDLREGGRVHQHQLIVEADADR